MSGEFPQYSIESDPYSEFTWLNPSMIIEEATPDVGGTPESAIAKYVDTPSYFDAPCSGRSPVSCGSLQLFNSFSLSPLFQHPPCDLYSDDNVLRNSVRSLDEGEDPIFTPPPLRRRGSPPSETPVPASSVRELECLQPVKTMKPFCTRLSGHWTLEKSLCTSCRRDGGKHLFPRLTSLHYLRRDNRKPRGRPRCYRRSSHYGSGPRANLARGGYKASLSTPPRILNPVVSDFLSLIDGDRLHLSQVWPHQCLYFIFHCL